MESIKLEEYSYSNIIKNNTLYQASTFAIHPLSGSYYNEIMDNIFKFSCRSIYHPGGNLYSGNQFIQILDGSMITFHETKRNISPGEKANFSFSIFKPSVKN